MGRPPHQPSSLLTACFLSVRISSEYAMTHEVSDFSEHCHGLLGFPCVVSFVVDLGMIF